MFNVYVDVNVGVDVAICSPTSTVCCRHYCARWCAEIHRTITALLLGVTAAAV